MNNSDNSRERSIVKISVGGMSVITAIDAAEVKEKQVLTLGCFYADANLKNAVSDFNKNSEDYVINVDSYVSAEEMIMSKVK